MRRSDQRVFGLGGRDQKIETPGELERFAGRLVVCKDPGDIDQEARAVLDGSATTRPIAWYWMPSSAICAGS